jgi:hypothetical protein
MLKKCQNTIYIVKRSHVAADLIRKYEIGKISRLEFVSKVTYRHKKEWYMI